MPYFILFLFLFLFFAFYCFLGPHPWLVEIPRLGVEFELQLPAYTTAIATSDLSLTCNLYSLWQCWIPTLLSKARDRTWILVRFITTEPRQELLVPYFRFHIYFIMVTSHGICLSLSDLLHLV